MTPNRRPSFSEDKNPAVREELSENHVQKTVRVSTQPISRKPQNNLRRRKSQFQPNNMPVRTKLNIIKLLSTTTHSYIILH